MILPNGILLGLLALFVSLAHAWSSQTFSPISRISRNSHRNRLDSLQNTRSRRIPPVSNIINMAPLLMTQDSNEGHSSSDDSIQSDTSASSMDTTSSTSSSTPRGGDDNASKSRYSKYNFSVVAILASAFLNLLGFTMAGPITPALGQHFELRVGSKFGSLTSAYPLGMLLGLFLWPQLSDRVGRKPVIFISLLGSGLGLGLQAVAIYENWGLLLFLATRVLTGSFAGSSPVSKAFLADVGTAQGKLPRYLALRDAAATLAFIVGPMLGGILFDVQRSALTSSSSATSAAASTTSSLAFVISVSAVASLAAAALVAVGVKEVPPQRHKQAKQPQNEETKEMAAASCPLGVSLWAGVATVCVLSFLFNVGDSTFHAFFPSLLKEKLALNTRSIGLAYTVFACISFCVSATIAGQSIQRNGPVSNCALGLSAVGMGLFGLALCQGWWILAAAALYYSGVPLYGPTIPTMLLQCVPSHKRGAVMGLDGAINTVARVIAPLLMGEVYRRAGSAMAFSVAGASVMTAASMACVRRYLVWSQRDKNNNDNGDLVVKMKQA